MFKCQVINIIKGSYVKETYVKFKVSDVGNFSTNNHSLTGTYDSSTFTIGQIDNSIRVGDLLRCDGLPYMSRPTTSDKRYKSFQLESGYWVLRKK